MENLNDAFFAVWNEQIAKVDAMANAVGALEVMLRVVVMHSPDKDHLLTELTVSAQGQPDAALSKVMLDSIQRMRVELK